MTDRATPNGLGHIGIAGSNTRCAHAAFAIGSTDLTAKALYQLGDLLTRVLLKEVRRVIE